ncbi:hypothetical protein [Thomasclavelia spiroformis]|uniref:hypothetical protein n=1 Tax=Thomasclavelia spiroformis TaxID=29348 RepID=UPI001FA112C1|nr:hypothetical protein [Thomasclavelia spiroformis]HIT11201.1 hypothetical protein [Candidatus Pelethosoma merdigallinarum]
MKKLIYNLLFVMSVMIVSFVGISGAEAKDYSYAKCTYTDDLKGGKFNLTIEYGTDGNIVIPKEIVSNDVREVCSGYSGGVYFGCETKTEEKARYKVVSVGLKASDFLSGHALNAVCPGSNDIDYYQVDSSKTIYIAWSESQLDKYIKDHNLSGGTKYKAKTTKQGIHQGDTIKIDGKDYDVKTALTCNYSGSGLYNTINITLNFSSDGTLLSSSVTAPDAPSAKITKVEGGFSGKKCVRSISISDTTHGDPHIGAKTERLTLYRNPSKGAHKLELTNKDNEPGTGENTKPNDIELSDKDGCGIWGSLLLFLRDDIFGVIKAVLIGFLIVLGMLDVAKASMSGEDNTLKKALSNFVKRIIIVVLIFILPLLIETAITWILPEEEIETCISDF